MSISGYHHSMALNIVHCTRFRMSPSTITSVVAGIYGRKMWFQSGCFPQVELVLLGSLKLFYVFKGSPIIPKARESIVQNSVSSSNVLVMKKEQCNDRVFNLKRKMRGRYPLSNQAQINFFDSLQGVWSVKYFCLLEGFNFGRQSMSKSQDNIETSQ